MRILEVRDGFIKFEAEKNYSLSSFLEIDDSEKSYIAQIIQIKQAGLHLIVYAKLLYIFYNGGFLNYDKTLPSANAEIKDFSYENFTKVQGLKTPIIIGNCVDDNSNILVEKISLDKNLLVSMDSQENTQILVSNLTKQIKNTIIIDTLGIAKSNKYTAGVDFKLPLNSNSLEFMYDDCLNDATSDSKNLIKEIFSDLAEYSNTVPFVPFGTLKAIVDDMVEKSHIFKLLVLKNKLAKFDKLGYFASSKEEVDNLSRILTTNGAIIDLSKLDTVFQNRYLSVIYAKLESLKDSPQVIVLASNSLNKKCLKKLISGYLPTAFITHSRFKYLNEIKGMFKNYIIEPNFANNEVFKIYSTFLSAMQKNTYLVVGEETGFLPLVSNIQELNYLQVSENASEEHVDSNENKDFNDIELALALEDSDPSVQAINKKSEVLIEKVAEEIQVNQGEEIEIFNTEESEDSDEEELEVAEELEEITNNEITIEDSINDTPLQEKNNEEATFIEPLDESLIDNNNDEIIELTADPLEEYHTEVDTIQTIEVSEEISLMTEEAELISEADVEENLEDLQIVEDDTEIQEEIINDNSDSDIIELDSETSDILEQDSVTEESILEEDFEETESLDSSEEMIILEQEETPSNEVISEEQTEVYEAIPLQNGEEDFDTIVELDDSEISEDDILVEIDEFSEEDSITESLDKEIVEDVDKVFTTIKEEDAISDSDLDFIDELNNNLDDSGELIEKNEEFEEIEGLEELTEYNEDEQEDEFIQPVTEISDSIEYEDLDSNEILETRNNTTPIIPVYEAEIPQEDMVASDPVEQGDTVVHAKYGNGVVEKMIKYGNKTLYSINFDNVGRRLLDPSIAEIKKA